jgi:hypothetical protein
VREGCTLLAARHETLGKISSGSNTAMTATKQIIIITYRIEIVVVGSLLQRPSSKRRFHF